MVELKTDLTVSNNSHLVDHDRERQIEAAIADMEDNAIREALDKRRSFKIFENKQPTSNFLKMETSKGYTQCQIHKCHKPTTNPS